LPKSRWRAAKPRGRAARAGAILERVLGRVATAFVALVLGACPASKPPEEGPAPANPTMDRTTLLKTLRQRLDRLPQKPSAPVNDGGDLPLEALAGATCAELRDALGTPHTCQGVGYHDAQGNPHPVAPCESSTDWFYSFYRLPDGWVGGGPELLLQFDDQCVCVRALWRHTQ
jgi:hypothetical protein